MIVDSTLSSIQKAENLNKTQKAEIINHLYVQQESTYLDDHLMSIYKSVDLEQRKLIEFMFLTYKDQIKQSKVIQDLNQDLKNKLESLQLKQSESNQIIHELNEYRKRIETDQQVKLLAKQKRLNRKQREKTQPLTLNDFETIITAINNNKHFTTNTRIRFHVTTLIFMLTGVRISELLNIKVSQILSLIFKGHIAIDRAKKGPSNHKAFLTKTAKTILAKYKTDIVYLLQFNGIPLSDSILDTYYNETYSKLYLFSPEKTRGTKSYTRPFFTDSYNKLL